MPELTRAWRILCHPDHRHSRRVTAFFDFVADELVALKPILTGLRLRLPLWQLSGDLGLE